MSVSGDLTTEDVVKALGPDAKHMTSAEIEEYRVAANVLSALACEVFKGQPRISEPQEGSR